MTRWHTQKSPLIQADIRTLFSSSPTTASASNTATASTNNNKKRKRISTTSTIIPTNKRKRSFLATPTTPTTPDLCLTTDSDDPTTLCPFPSQSESSSSSKPSTSLSSLDDDDKEEQHYEDPNLDLILPLKRISSCSSVGGTDDDDDGSSTTEIGTSKSKNKGKGKDKGKAGSVIKLWNDSDSDDDDGHGHGYGYGSKLSGEGDFGGNMVMDLDDTDLEDNDEDGPCRLKQHSVYFQSRSDLSSTRSRLLRSSGYVNTPPSLIHSSAWGRDSSLLQHPNPHRAENNVLGSTSRVEEMIEARMKGVGTSNRAGRWNRLIPHNDYLRTFVSSNETDVHRLPSRFDHLQFAYPFCHAFSSSSKQQQPTTSSLSPSTSTPSSGDGGPTLPPKILAVAAEEGTITLIPGEPVDGPGEISPRAHLKTLTPHVNAVFQLAWSWDDRIIATASGDQSARLTDVETNACLGVFGGNRNQGGHECSVKTVVWLQPGRNDLFATGSRDGSIRIWDQRCQSVGKYRDEATSTQTQEQQPQGHGGKTKSPRNHAPVSTILNAHGNKKKTTTSGKGKASVFHHSVTSIIPLHNWTSIGLSSPGPYIISSSASDSSLKIWDLRKSYNYKRKTPDAAEWGNIDCGLTSIVSMDSANGEREGTEGVWGGRRGALKEGGAKREYGIVSMCEGGGKIFAMNMNNVITAISPYHLASPSTSPVVAHYTDPSFRSRSFYLHLACSPNGRYLASGSHSGKLFLWDVETGGRAEVLTGHLNEVSMVDWGGNDLIATHADDNLVRFWRPNMKIASKCQEEDEDHVIHHWSGVWKPKAPSNNDDGDDAA